MHQDISTVGLDLEKRVFQVHGVSEERAVLVRRKLRRGEMTAFFAALPPCLVGMEACASAHHWARELEELSNNVRLMPPAYSKRPVRPPYSTSAKAGDHLRG